MKFPFKALDSWIIDSNWWTSVCARDYPPTCLINYTFPNQLQRPFFPLSWSINNFYWLLSVIFKTSAVIYMLSDYSLERLSRFYDASYHLTGDTEKHSENFFTADNDATSITFEDLFATLRRFRENLFCINFHCSVDNTSRATSYRKGSESTELTWKYMRQKTTTKAPQVLADR